MFNSNTYSCNDKKASLTTLRLTADIDLYRFNVFTDVLSGGCNRTYYLDKDEGKT
jgi:hypothetical protein